MPDDMLMMAIPDTIRVGFQERKDTYTNKLAYVIYIDEKGKVRKESSWESWRDTKLPAIDFQNVPTAGFVLNKKVGGYKSGWNQRQAAVRIYDPRGFEFEICIENLLFILEECDAIKGKGIEGQFVYAWDKSDLVLLPVTAHEYTSCRKFTDMKSQKVGKKDMTEGCVYVTKKMEQIMYLGHHDAFEYDVWAYQYGRRDKITKSLGKKHIFVPLTDMANFECHNGFTKLASKVSDDIHPNFATLYDKFKKSVYGNECKEVIVCKNTEEWAPLNVGWRDSLALIKKTDTIYTKISISKNHGNVSEMYEAYDVADIIIEDNNIVCKKYDSSTLFYAKNHRRNYKIYSKEEMEQMQFYQIFIVNEHNQKIQYYL